MDSIQRVIQSGGNVSYILYINILNTPSDDIQKQIIHDLSTAIHNVPYTKNIREMDVTIMWEKTASSDCHFHCDTYGIWSDTALQEHTKLLLGELIHNLGYRNKCDVTFLIVKPITRQFALL